jgi:hypothetical protein
MPVLRYLNACPRNGVLAWGSDANTGVCLKGEKNMRMKSFLATAVCAVAVAGAGAGAAFAGEVNGNGDPTAGPTHANSICVFSGQNDDPTAPLSLDMTIAPNGPGGISQSFGQDVKLGLDPRAFNPGDACGPGSNPDRQK